MNGRDVPTTTDLPLTRWQSAAADHYRVYRSYINAGFTDDQAFQIFMALMAMTLVAARDQGDLS